LLHFALKGKKPLYIRIPNACLLSMCNMYEVCLAFDQVAPCHSLYSQTPPLPVLPLCPEAMGITGSESPSQCFKHSSGTTHDWVRGTSVIKRVIKFCLGTFSANSMLQIEVKSWVKTPAVSRLRSGDQSSHAWICLLLGCHLKHCKVAVEV
jgi:hypothetical protein